MADIAVLGAGSWGTALAVLLARNGCDTLLWGRNPERMAALEQARLNARYLPGCPFPGRLHAGADLEQAVRTSRHLLVAVPSHVFGATLRTIQPLLPAAMPIAWATKGLEQESCRLLSEVAREALGDRHPLAVVSGPTFALEVGRGLPTAVTVAGDSTETAAGFARLLHGDTFRAYTSDDMIGVQVGGASKNVLAIGAGIIDGLGFGANTRAALITRGLAEMVRLGEALGGRRETFMGLAGLGDLILTCTDNQSRNRRAGLALGQGKGMEEAVAEIGQVVEGIQATPVVVERARQVGVEVPIMAKIEQVLFDGLSARTAVEQLLMRDPKPETW